MQNTYSKDGLVLDMSVQKLRETGRDIIRDKSRHMNHGMCINGTNIIQTKEGICAGSFDGVNDYVDCGNDESLNIISAITIEAWVNTNSLEDRKIITRVKGSQWVDRVYQMYVIGGKINWMVYNGLPNGIIDVKSGAIETGKWYRVVGTFDSSYVRLYVNNVKYETLNTIGTLTSNPSIHTRIGTWITSNYFHGLIDEVHIYNRALSAEEVRGNMFTSKRYRYMRGVQKCGVQ